MFAIANQTAGPNWLKLFKGTQGGPGVTTRLDFFFNFKRTPFTSFIIMI